MSAVVSLKQIIDFSRSVISVMFYTYVPLYFSTNVRNYRVVWPMFEGLEDFFFCVCVLQMSLLSLDESQITQVRVSTALKTDSVLSQHLG